MTPLARVFALYRLHHSPRKRTEGERRQDGWRSGMWQTFLGRELGRDPLVEDLSLALWERFEAERYAGLIDAHGREVPSEAVRPIRPRSVQADQLWLRSVLRWACSWQMEDGAYVIPSRTNPVIGFHACADPTPRQRVYSCDEWRRLRQVSDRVSMEVRWYGTRIKVGSYLSAMLDFAKGSGRRAGAIRMVQWPDIKRVPRPDGLPRAAPWHGLIVWRADSDKMGVESITPIDPLTHGAIIRLDRHSLWLFPSPSSIERPVSYRLMRRWLELAERMADVRPKGWHGFRRARATELIDVNAKIVARYMGWKSLESVFRYQQPTVADIASAIFR